LQDFVSNIGYDGGKLLKTFVVDGEAEQHFWSLQPCKIHYLGETYGRPISNLGHWHHDEVLGLDWSSLHKPTHIHNAATDICAFERCGAGLQEGAVQHVGQGA
jgi:hypothetical protein